MREYEKLKQMVGNGYTYKGSKYHIKGFVPEEQTVRILTDKEDIVLLDDGLTHHLTYFKCVGLVKSEVQNSIGTLAEILRDNINRVRENRDYIPQAESINSSVKTMIDLAKAEIDYRKTELEFMKLNLGE